MTSVQRKICGLFARTTLVNHGSHNKKIHIAVDISHDPYKFHTTNRDSTRPAKTLTIMPSEDMKCHRANVKFTRRHQNSHGEAKFTLGIYHDTIARK
jgi:hypothetical protein